TYHHTFFEMLGNWSFGDYFKADSIKWAWELFTEVWKLDKNILYATVFGGDEADGLGADEEAENLWKKLTDIDPSHVMRFGRKANFWEMGEMGPCGPCSEIHIDRGPEFCDKKGVPGHVCQVNGDCARYMELWNLVFIQMERLSDGSLKNLPSKHVDTGAGLERVVSVLQNKLSNYDTDLFTPIMDAIGKLSGKKYTSKLGDDTDNAFRVIADHVRMLTFSISDGALPSNEGRGYILRRLLRRAARFGLILDLHEPFIYKLVPTVVDLMGESYPEIITRKEHVMTVIQAEEASFARTLERGIALFNNDVTDLKAQGQMCLPGDKAFRLYDTYGFPLDLTALLAEEAGMTVDTDGFDKLMAEQKQRARAAQKSAVYEGDMLADKLPETNDSYKYQHRSLTARVLGFVDGNEYITSGAIPVGKKVGLVLDNTCAYAESGGQIGDSGAIVNGPAVFSFGETKKAGKAIVHFGQIDNIGIKTGDTVSVSIDSRRADTARNHTATHLLQWALQQVLGDHVHQEGSQVTSENLRFDFTHPKALTSEEICQVEELIRQKINTAVPVNANVMPLDEAKKLGAMALFSEKYGNEVRVIAVGDDLHNAFSREFCGGCHVDNTAEIGAFMITREESVATGVRRITAMTGRSLNDMLYSQSRIVTDLCVTLKARPEELKERVEALIDNNKKLQKQLKKGSGNDVKTIVANLLNDAADINGTKIVIGQLPEVDVDVVRGQLDWIKSQAQSCVSVLATVAEEEGKVMLFAAVTDDLIKKGVQAGAIVKEIAPIVGGGGGGKPQMAQAGGKQPENVEKALAKARDMLSALIK
ncbi:MAG: alanine--tRNA ligase, partial [Sedimentisphaerales bacterium]|nr:alanine--tRNA ligase [Sedimentisphaerales bacterium]